MAFIHNYWQLLSINFQRTSVHDAVGFNLVFRKDMSKLRWTEHIYVPIGLGWLRFNPCKVGYSFRSNPRCCPPARYTPYWLRTRQYTHIHV